MECGRYSQAIEHYDKALKLKPEDTEAMINKGVALMKQDKYEEADECYNKVLELDPQNKYACVNKGILLYEPNNYSEVEVCGDKTLQPRWWSCVPINPRKL